MTMRPDMKTFEEYVTPATEAVEIILETPLLQNSPSSNEAFETQESYNGSWS